MVNLPNINLRILALIIASGLAAAALGPAGAASEDAWTRGGQASHADEVVGVDAHAPTQPVWLDGPSLREQAESTGVIELPVLGRVLTVEVKPVEMRAPDWRGVTRGPEGEEVIVTREEVPSLGTYRARVEGAPDWTSSLTITDTFVSGALDLPDCSRLTLTNVGADAPEPPAEDLVYAEAILDPGVCMAKEAVPPSGSAPAAQPGTDATLTLEIGIDSDDEFCDTYGTGIYSAQAAVINDMEAHVWLPGVDVAWSIVLQVGWCNGSGPTDTVCDTLLDWFRNDWQARFPGFDRDTAIFMMHRDITGNSGTDTLGCGHQPGINTPETRGYSVMETLGVSSTLRYRLAAHETGHNAHGDHGYADEWWDWLCACHRHTINWPSIGGGDYTVDYWSQGSDLFANEYRVRLCVENREGCASFPKSGS